jgi:site-specific DNA recombinase
MEAKMNTALLYYRVSTTSQVEKGQGLEVQKKLCQDFCRAEGIEIAGEFSDEGISGATLDREGLGDLLASLNGTNYVVVANTSRLWRDDLSRALIQRELKKAGKDVKAVDNPSYTLYSDSPETFLVNSILELLDSYERLAVTLKLKRARKQKASRGQKASGPAPFGYEWTEVRSNGRKDKLIQPNAAEAESVKAIYAQYLKLGSVGALRRHLESVGIKTRRGGRFSRQSLVRILTNDFYTGVVRHGSVETDGKHEPILSRVTFGKIRAALARNRTHRKATA